MKLNFPRLLNRNKDSHKLLPKPTSHLQETLYELLTKESINVRQMIADTGMLHVKARLFDLRKDYNLPIATHMIQVTNKYGRTASFGQWSLLDKEQGKKVYLKLQGDA